METSNTCLLTMVDGYEKQMTKDVHRNSVMLPKGHLEQNVKCFRCDEGDTALRWALCLDYSSCSVATNGRNSFVLVAE